MYQTQAATSSRAAVKSSLFCRSYDDKTQKVSSHFIQWPRYNCAGVDLLPFCSGRPDKDKSATANPFALGSHPKTVAEDEANERRKKRFAREHDIEAARSSGDATVSVPQATTKMEQLSLKGKNAAGKGKKFGKGRLGLEEEEKMFDPVSDVAWNCLLLRFYHGAKRICLDANFHLLHSECH